MTYDLGSVGTYEQFKPDEKASKKKQIPIMNKRMSKTALSSVGCKIWKIASASGSKNSFCSFLFRRRIHRKNDIDVNT